MIRMIYSDKDIWKGNGYCISNNRYYFDDIGHESYDEENFFLSYWTEGLTKVE